MCGSPKNHTRKEIKVVVNISNLSAAVMLNVIIFSHFTNYLSHIKVIIVIIFCLKKVRDYQTQKRK